MRWRLSQLAYNVEVGNLGMTDLSPRERLQKLARETGISLRELQRHAEVWRVWMVPGEDGKTPSERIEEHMAASEQQEEGRE